MPSRVLLLSCVLDPGPDFQCFFLLDRFEGLQVSDQAGRGSTGARRPAQGLGGEQRLGTGNNG